MMYDNETKNERRKRKLPSGWKAFVFVIVFVYKKG